MLSGRALILEKIIMKKGRPIREIDFLSIFEYVFKDHTGTLKPPKILRNERPSTLRSLFCEFQFVACQSFRTV